MTSRCQDESADIVKVEIGVVVVLDIFDPVYFVLGRGCDDESRTPKQISETAPSWALIR